MMKSGTEAAVAKNPSEKTRELLESFSQELDALKKSLVVTTGDNYVGAARPELREKIAALYSEVADYPGRPSNAQMQNLELLSAQLETAKGERDALTGQLGKINQALAAEALPEITYRSLEAFLEADI